MSTVRPTEPTLDERAVRKGIAIMLVGLTIFALLNAMVKDLAAAFPVNQIVFFRSAAGLVPLVVLMRQLGARPNVKFRPIAANLPHAAMMTALLLTAYVGFAMLPLGEATAIFFLSPVLVAALSALVLRERLPRRLWIAVAIGFLGVIVIARPTDLRADLGIVYGLAAAVFGAVTMLQQRQLAQRYDALEIVFWFMALSALALTPTLLVWWSAPSPAQWLSLIVMGVLSGIGQFLLVLPMKYAPASRLAPMYYTNLLGGIVIGYFWFGEVPDGAMIVGSLIVAASTALVLTADSRPSGAADAAPGPTSAERMPPTLSPSLAMASDEASPRRSE